MKKVCMITGSSRGIGKGIATAFAKDGEKIIINYLTHYDDAKETAEELAKKYHVEVEIIKANVSKEEEVIQMIKKAKEKFGRVDVLINNAGVHKDSVVWKMNTDVWNEVISTNLTGAFLCTKHVIPLMRENGWGRIINISSVVGQVGTFGTSNYSASKSALFGFTKGVAREVADRNITVNCVALGYIEAGMNLRLSEEVRERVLQVIPVKRFGKIEEVGDLVVFLCTSEASSYITGQVIHINGGYYM